MEKKLTQLAGCFQKMEITVPVSELEPYYEKGYNEARKSVQMPGFRKGKVPMNMIKKHYGPAIIMEAEQDAINEIFPKLAQEDNIPVFGQPSLTNIEKTDDAVIYSIEYETNPDFQLADYKSMTIDEPVHAVEDSEIDAEIQKIQNENADFEVAQKVEDSNYVVGITMEPINPDSKELIEDAEKQEFHVYLNDEKVIPELKDSLLGKDINEVYEFENPKPNPEMIDKTSLFRVTVNDIQKLIPKELTEEYIKEYTKGRFDNIDDLKEEIGFQLQEELDKKSRERMENQIIEKLLELQGELSVPEHLVENVMKSMFEDFKKQYANLPKNAFNYDMMKETLKPQALNTVRFEFIKNKIVEIEDLKIEDHDIMPFVDEYVKSTGMSEDEVKEMLLKNESFLNSILSKKVMDFILDFTETREIDFEGNPLDEDLVENTDIEDTADENSEVENDTEETSEDKE